MNITGSMTEMIVKNLQLLFVVEQESLENLKTETALPDGAQETRTEKETAAKLLPRHHRKCAAVLHRSGGAASAAAAGPAALGRAERFSGES